MNNVKKICFAVLVILCFGCTKNIEKQKTENITYSQDEKSEILSKINKFNKDITNIEIYYLNTHSDMWLQEFPGGSETGSYMLHLHKTKVVVTEEKEGWKRVDFDIDSKGLPGYFGPYWFEDKYFAFFHGFCQPKIPTASR